MTAIPTPFGSSAGKYKFMGDAALVNCHAELRDDGGKAKYVIVPADGSTLFSSVADTPLRGAIYMEDLDLVYAVFSGRIYRIDSAGGAINTGLMPGQDKVRIVRNQKDPPQIVIRTDSGVYVVESNLITKITDDDLPDVEDIVEMDGYIVFIIADGRYFLSSINEAGDIDALDFASAEQASDKLVAGWSWGGYLMLFGQRTIEPHKNTGNADFPFEPMPTVIPRGLLAKFSIASLDNSIAFIGDDGIVYRLEGFQPVRISNHEVERLIQAEADPSLIEAQSWSRAGHAFYELKGASFSRAYDANTKQWCTRETYGQDTWRHTNAIQAWNKILVGDKLGGSLYYLDATVHTETSNTPNTQVAKIRFPTLNTFHNGGILDAVHLDFVTGQGVLLSTATGFDPNLMIRISKDGGYTYGGERDLKTGKRGVYGRVTGRRFGAFGANGAVIELSMSDPVGRGLALAAVDVRPLKK